MSIDLKHPTHMCFNKYRLSIMAFCKTSVPRNVFYEFVRYSSKIKIYSKEVLFYEKEGQVERTFCGKRYSI